MAHNIDAIYDHGVLRPTEPLQLAEGTRVHLRVEEENGHSANGADYNTWLDGLAGRWQGEFVRVSEGNSRTRLS